MSTRVTDEELSRSRNQLKAMLLMNLEMKNVSCEDMVRQVATMGRRLGSDELVAHIDAVTARDVQAAATSMLRSPVSLGAYGNLTKCPPREVLEENLAAAFGRE